MRRHFHETAAIAKTSTRTERGPKKVEDMLVQRGCLGPQVSLSVAFVVGAMGWGGMWAAVNFESLHVPYAGLLLLAFLQGQGMSCTDIACVETVAKSFPECRGRALGIVKAFDGLSSSFASAAYLGFFAPSREYLSMTSNCRRA